MKEFNNMYLKIFRFIISIFIVLIFTSCEKKISTNPKEIHWDRDMCSRCAMVISDRNHAVQVINPEDGKAYVFDDIGCTILWFKEQNVKWEEKAVIWITDIKTAKWIDAKKAFYDTMNLTPMAYGFGAHEIKSDIQEGLEVIDYEKVKQRVLEIGK
jgi:nitrous oxide reductase accessory protein NosL